MANINFLGEQIAGRTVLDMCNSDDTLTQILTMNTCGKREVVSLNSVLTALPGYDAGETQALQHVLGVLQWVTIP